MQRALDFNFTKMQITPYRYVCTRTRVLRVHEIILATDKYSHVYFHFCNSMHTICSNQASKSMLLTLIAHQLRLWHMHNKVVPRCQLTTEFDRIHNSCSIFSVRIRASGGYGTRLCVNKSLFNRWRY